MAKAVAARRKKKAGNPVAVKGGVATVKCGYCKGTGTDRWGVISVMSNCQVCKGKGEVQIEKPYKECLVCRGRGFERNKRVTCLACGGKGVVHIEKGLKKCPACGGTGKMAHFPKLYCVKCKGKGVV